jgi:hypothetical protein
MGTPDSRKRWTLERQLRFLDALFDTRNIGKAATVAGMSRESAYRLRNRRDGILFAALWDRIMSPAAVPSIEGRSQLLTDGHLARLLGNHFRRERGDFASIGTSVAESRAG